MSNIQKTWNILDRAPQKFLSQFKEYNPTILQLLYNRKIDTKDKINNFFNPQYSDLHDPFLFKDMDRALKRLEKAMASKERLAVYGDYDADGVTSSIILTSLFKKVLGLSGQVYIPDRTREGYGLNKKAIDWLIKKDIKLIVTCDCGVSDKKEINYAHEKGIDTIVFDHHHLTEEFSNDYIVINAKREGDCYPYKELSAVGVVFKLVQAVFKSDLINKTETEFKNNKEAREMFEKELLDLVALGTVADCSSLTLENRVLVKEGLKVLSKTKRTGFVSLARSARVDLKNIDSFGIGFYLAPRVNAAGRLDHANVAYRLLSTEHYGVARLFSYQLELANRKRQKITDEIFREVKKGLNLSKKVLIASKEGWPLGVLGIVASKICEEYFKPALILSQGEDESAGSARSIPSFNIIEALNGCSDLLLEFGGHAGAAGCSLENKNLEKLSLKLNKIAEKILSKDDLIPKINIETKINLEDVNWNFYDILKKFEPYGADNQRPIFCARNVEVVNFSRLGKNKNHLKLILADRGRKGQIEALYFNINREKLKNLGNEIDIIFNIEVNEWNGKKDLQLKLIDFRRAN